MTETQMPANAPELRPRLYAPLDRIEIREAGDASGEFTLSGHAAVFDHWSEELGSIAGPFREKIAPGAFADVLDRQPDVRLLFNHDGLALARTKSGTLELTEDEEGLRVWARLAPTSTATDLRMAMQRRDVDQMSFAFTVAEDEWHQDSDEEITERTILRVGELFDVSVVTFAAYPDTAVVMREIRAAADAGKIHPVAPAEIDPVGEETAPVSAEAETDPPVGDERDVSASAETDPTVGGTRALEELREFTKERTQQERERYLRLLKEITRK